MNVFSPRGVGLSFLAALLVVSTAHAEPRYARMYKQQYGYVPSCNACHKDGGGTALNVYGAAYKEAEMGLAAFARIAEQDADGDGAANAAEAQAKSNPGQAASTPANAGDWLNTANLIPREIQAVFKGVTAYKPLDTLLTDSELARALALGVTLTDEDETTIYIPVDAGKPAGTAIIVPTQFGDATFFVLLATDRQLNVTHAQALHADKVKGADAASLYQSAIGMNVEALPVGGTDSLAGAVQAGLKKAGTLILVRLKKP